MNEASRRVFLKTIGVAAAAGSIPFSPEIVQKAFAKESSGSKTKKAARLFDLGMASYTFRQFTLDQVIDMTKRLGMKKITLKDMHLPLKSSDAELVAAIEKMKQAGLEPESCGVVYMRSEDEVRQAFAYAKKAGMKMIVGGPDKAMLPLCERVVKETDIILAIHNHGPTDKNYPSPEDAYKAVANMDKRMGVCIDVSHTQRIGLDPTDQLTKCFDRVFDIHIKDVSAAQASGTTVEIGRGVIDIPKLLKQVIKLNYSHTLHFEFEKDAKDPLPGLAESVGYVRGVLASL
ncbi:MAG TPA: sugar phosphate isomerase/epimerase [Clostridia bacterium]|nr:sugar phosphate isomerase/epimerase [Clostridia bacterium]